MSRFELTIDPNYVPHWTIQDGLRELIQNALDESIINSDNSMDITRDGTSLLISTKNAKLSKQTLLIGSSSKRDNTNTIGKEGEGYKLACLVLIRAGHKVIIHNYSEKERWIPRIINSRRYNSKLLVIDTEKYRWTSPPNYDLTFEVKGINDDIYNSIVKRTLFLRETHSSVLSYNSIGEVLLDKEEAGRVYVNGLYISTVKDSIKYGYNFNPDKIELDRDRRAVTDFNLTWVTSQLWANFSNRDEYKELIKNGNKDIQYIDSFTYNPNNDFKEFQKEFGSDTYPVVNQEDHDYVKSTYQGIRPIIVNEVRCKLIKKSNAFQSKQSNFKIKNKDIAPSEMLTIFYNRFKNNFTTQMISEFDLIKQISKDWK